MGWNHSCARFRVCFDSKINIVLGSYVSKPVSFLFLFLFLFFLLAVACCRVSSIGCTYTCILSRAAKGLETTVLIIDFPYAASRPLSQHPHK